MPDHSSAFFARKPWVFFVICFVVLLLATLTPLGTVTASNEVVFYDDFSHNLMKGDLRYMHNFGLDGLLPRYLNPGDELTGRSPFTSAKEVDAFLRSNDILPAGDYATYTSNITIQRYAYRLIDMLIPGAPANSYPLLEALQSVLFSASLAGVLTWMRRYAGNIATFLVLVALAFFSPIFIGFSSNLYWAGYTWFIPLLGSAYTLARKPKAKSAKGWHALCFWVAFATCLFKQLHYFEFVSSVMIGMLLPYICHLVTTLPASFAKWKTWLQTLFWPALGAVASFATAMLLKLGAMAVSAPAEATGANVLTTTLANILKRTGGQTAAQELAAQGYDISLIGTLKAMLKAPALTLRGRISVNFFTVCILLLVLTLALLAFYYVKKQYSKHVNALFCAAWVSLIAPVFWFVVFKLHVVDHIKIDLIAWYLPFIPLAYGAIAAFAVWLASTLFAKNTLPKEAAQ